MKGRLNSDQRAPFPTTLHHTGRMHAADPDAVSMALYDRFPNAIHVAIFATYTAGYFQWYVTEPA